MKIEFKGIPKFEIGGRPFYLKPDDWRSTSEDETYYQNQVSGLTNGNIQNSEKLSLDSNRNNIYFNGDWNNYHNWHSQNIVLPWLNKTNPTTAKETNWENLILNTLNSWNDAGGFQWLYATPEQRQHGMQSNQTKVHQDTYYNDPLLREEDNIIGQNKNNYIIPNKANTADRFSNGTRVGLNGQVSDRDFGIQTGNRRPTIHVNTEQQITQQWDNYYKNLGFVGKYRYLDHWVPTKDLSRAEIKFDTISSKENDIKDDGITEVTGDNSTTDLETKHKDKYGFDWDKVRGSLQKSVPGIIENVRLVGNYINNEHVYGEALKGIRPDLMQSYNTYRQVVGDEATKQAYYRRAIQGQTRAARPFTSDADKQMAYQFEAKRVGDELKAQGDLADNQRIRETAEQSSQHLDANRQRATEVANANNKAINYANSLKHNLLAQKHAANWTSFDNYLQGIATRYDKNKELINQMWQLNKLNEIEDDPELNRLKAKYEAAIKKPENQTVEYGVPTINYNSQELRKIQKEINQQKRRLQIKAYQEKLLLGKSGTKIVKKTKNDLLYKSTRDAVEHFRKMSKISSDAQNRKRIKIDKLTPHPKGNTKKYQQGGVAPFTIYKPTVLGGETTTSTQTDTSGTKSSKESTTEKDKLDMIKELFKAIQGQGLPIDVSMAYREISDIFSRTKALGEDLTVDDIASMYLKSMNTISRLKYSKEVYNKAKERVIANEATDEIAVDSLGNYVVQDRSDNGKIKTIKSLEEISEDLVPLTNNQLLNLRAYNPSLALSNGDNFIDNIVYNGMGINKIGALIKNLAGNIGQSEDKLEGISQVESGKVKAGIQLLSQATGTPDGHYKITNYTKDQKNQIQAALMYINNMLSPAQKAILKAHGGVEENIMLFLGSQQDYNREQTISPLTGKAANKDGSSTSTKSGAESSAGLAFVLGQGPRELISFNTGTSNEIEVLGIKGVLQTKSNENLGQGSTLQDATKSQQGGYLQWNKATFGGSKLNSSAYNHIILNDSTILGVDLPYTKDINGNEIPDFQLLRKMEKADEDIRKNNITDINQINQIYIKHELDPKYTSDGKLNQLKYKRFAAIQATLDEQSLQNKEAILSDEVALAGDVERDLYKEIMKKSNKDYDLDDGILGYFRDNLYKGTIFIPYSEDIAFAALSSGHPFNQDPQNLPNNVTAIQEKQYAPKISQYVSPQLTLSQIKNN